MPGKIRDSDGQYVEAGEATGAHASFTADEVATAFAIDRKRVHRAMQGEFGLGPDATVDSRMAQQLCEVLLADLPLDRREAALMELGAFTPRSDANWGLGSGPPDEESDRQSAEAGVSDTERVSKRSSYDPATQSAKKSLAVTGSR